MDKKIKDIKEAFQSLMGINGNSYAQEICDTNQLSQRSYDEICANIKYNGEESITKYFGLVHCYYLKGLK